MAESLSVLMVVHNPTQRGGAYFRARGLAKPLVRRGHDITVLAIHPTTRLRMVESEIEGFKVVESPDLLPGIGRSGWDPWDTLRRTLWLRKQRFDIIHTIDTRPAVCLPALFARRSAGAKWVADWTDWWGRGGATTERKNQLVNAVMGPIEQLFEEKPRPYADGTVVISKALGERAVGLGIPASAQLYLPPGADPHDIRQTTIAEARASLGLAPSVPLLGYLGNIYPNDADLLFETLRSLRHEARLVMVGDPGVEVPDDLVGRVDVLGRVPFGTMLDHLSACDALVLPMTDSTANRGRWPSKINEYVAVGRPTVACAVGDVASLISDHDIGLLCAPEAAEFAGQIDALLDDPARASKMGENARNLALNEYSQDAVAERLEHYYLEVLQGTGQRPRN